MLLLSDAQCLFLALNIELIVMLRNLLIVLLYNNLHVILILLIFSITFLMVLKALLNRVASNDEVFLRVACARTFS